jgi:plasmid segregation protein ParM
MKDFYVLDPGHGDYKITSNQISTVETFPAIVGQMNTYDNLDLGSNNKSIENMSIKKDDKEFAVGKMALKNSVIRNHDTTEDKYTSFESMLLAHTSLSLTSTKSFSIGNLVLGIPVHKMPVARSIANKYKGNSFGAMLGFYGQYEGSLKTVSIDGVTILGQPHGTLLNLVLGDNGEIEDKDMAKRGIGVFDIGYKTNDGIVFQGLEPVGRLTINSKNGMHVAYEQIRSVINRDFNGLELKTFEVPEVIKSGIIRGQRVDDIINDAFYNLASNIISEIKSKWDDAWEIEKVVFTGGGAELLKPYLVQAFKDSIYCGRTDNAKGFLKYAYRMWGDK